MKLHLQMAGVFLLVQAMSLAKLYGSTTDVGSSAAYLTNTLGMTGCLLCLVCRARINKEVLSG